LPISPRSAGANARSRLPRTQEWPIRERAGFVRDYDSFADSIDDHFRFLRDDKRYADVFQARSDQAYFEALQRSGYATDPDFAKSLMTVLKSVQNLEDHMSIN
jgi:flagellum-specific peptidoglycan hydrolase FlgJ